MERPLFIPVILGTARQGRQSEHAARLDEALVTAALYLDARDLKSGCNVS
jgi:hypothetical protein